MYVYSVWRCMVPCDLMTYAAASWVEQDEDMKLQSSDIQL